MFQWLLDVGGELVGYAEMLGFKYPVKAYQAPVSDMLWRGSRVDADGLKDLSNRGFKLVVNLCAEMYDNADVAKECGLKTFHIAIMDNQPPTDKQMVDFVNVVSLPENQPAYVHCEAGIGRTSVAVACYRIAIQHWKPEDALVEAKKYGLRLMPQENFIMDFGTFYFKPPINL